MSEQKVRIDLPSPAQVRRDFGGSVRRCVVGRCCRAYAVGFLLGVLAALTVCGCGEGKAPSAVGPGSGAGANTTSGDSSDGPRGGEAVSELVFADVSDRLGSPVEYENGEDADRKAILESLGGGVGVADFDGDGRLDLCFPTGGTFMETGVVGLPSRLFRSRPDARFEDVSGPSRIGAAGRYSHGCALTDFDSDGFVDIVITGFGGATLWRNAGDGTFWDATESSGVSADTQWSSSAAFGDVNGDGAPDLYLAHYVDWSPQNNPPCNGPSGRPDVCPPKRFAGLDDTLFLNNGDGTFRDATAEAGLVAGGKGLGVVLADFDADGDVDVYVANDTTPNFLYVNRGDGVFDERGLLSGTATDAAANANGSMGIAVTDANLDGRFDICVTNYEDETTALYRSLGDVGFLEDAQGLGLSRLGTLFVGFGCAAGDFDLDGDEDLAIANGHVVHFPRNAPVRQQPLLLQNNAGRGYERAVFPSESYFSQGHRGRGLATADIDDDGDLDLVFTNVREPAAVLRNDTPTAGRSLRIRLIGTVSARIPVGTRVQLEFADRTQIRQVVGGGSYASDVVSDVHFGIAAGSRPQALRIAWPGGATTRVAIPADAFEGRPHRRLTVREGAAGSEAWIEWQ